MESMFVVLLFAGICQVMTAPYPAQQLEDYLYNYGYLPATDAERGVKRSASDLEQATMRLQKFMGLEITGKLDEATLELLGKARCGKPDMVVKDDDLLGIVEVNDGPANYTLHSSSWNSADFPVTYGYVNFSPDCSQSSQTSVMDASIKKWTDVSQLRSQKVSDANSADIKISFGTGEHAGGCSAFPSGVLAHAYYPGSGWGGDAHFNDAYTHTAGTGGNYALEWTATHEFGHSFGIQHSGNGDAVMNPYYNLNRNGGNLHSDDIAGIRAKYGA